MASPTRPDCDPNGSNQEGSQQPPLIEIGRCVGWGLGDLTIINWQENHKQGQTWTCTERGTDILPFFIAHFQDLAARSNQLMSTFNGF
jgi:hypothetical protein